MNESDAAILVGTLQAAFPAGGSPETTALYLKLFERYDAEPSTKAVQELVATREDAFLPPWAEVRAAILRHVPPPPREVEPATSGPPEEAREAMQRLKEAYDERAEQLTEHDKLRVAVRRRYVRERQSAKLAESTGVPEEAA